MINAARFIVIFLALFLGILLLNIGCRKDPVVSSGLWDCTFQDMVSGPHTQLLFSYTKDTSKTATTRNGLYVAKENLSWRIRNDYGANDYPANPRWSPDGLKIAYNPGVRCNGHTFGDSILIIHANGFLHSKPVSNCGRNGCIFPAWSPDGNQLAYCRSENNGFSIRIIDLEHGSEDIVANLPGTPYGLDWSPAGDRFICVSNQGIYHLNTDGSGLAHCNCLEDFAGTIGCPRWDPSGTRLLFTRKYWSSIPPIFTALINGDELQEIAYGLEADWTADGQYIVYYSNSFYGIRSDGTGEPFILFSGNCYPFSENPSFIDLF